MEKIKKHKSLIVFFILICMMSIISTTIILDKVAPKINNYNYYEEIDKFKFHTISNENSFKTEYLGRKVKLSWQNLNEKVYISSFDNALNAMPSDNYLDVATIPDGSKSIQIDISLQGTYNDYIKKDFDAQLYLITYNEKGQVTSSNKGIVFDSLKERARNHTLKMKIDKNSKKYKILIRINPVGKNGSSGYIMLSDLDVIFN